MSLTLYHAPEACSLADCIALHEVGADFRVVQVDLRTRLTLGGADFRLVTPKGYVPALVLEDGSVLTENIAVLHWISLQYPQLSAPGAMGQSRLLEALAFISTEIHRTFKPMWHSGSDRERAKAAQTVTGLLTLMTETMTRPYLFGAAPTVADFYLYVMLRWAERFGVEVPPQMAELRTLMAARPSVQRALQAET